MEGQHDLGTGPRGTRLDLCVADAATPSMSVWVSRLSEASRNSEVLSAKLGVRPSQEAHSTSWQIEDEGEFVECVRQCGLRADESLPWLQETARVFGAPIRVNGIGLSRGRVQLWPKTTQFQWENRVYEYPEMRRVLGEHGAWQLVWLGDDVESEGLEVRVCSGVTWIPMLWNLDEALMAARRFGTSPTWPSWFGFGGEQVDVQYTLEVPDDWWRMCMAERVPGRKIIENVWGDTAFNLANRVRKDKDVRVGTSIVDETVTAAAHSSASASWAREERSLREWYQWLRFTGEHPYVGGSATWVMVFYLLLGLISEWLCLGTYLYFSHRFRLRFEYAWAPVFWGFWVLGGTYGFWNALFLLTWAWYWGMWSQARVAFVCLNPRPRVTVRVSDDWNFEAAVVVAEGDVPVPPPPVADAPVESTPPENSVAEPGGEEESLGQSEWTFEERSEGMEWVVPPEYYVKVGGDQKPELRTMETRMLGVHYQKSASFVVTKLADKRPGIVRSWNQIPVRPGFTLEMKGEIPELGSDLYGDGRITFYQSFGIPGYWPTKSAHMTANTCALRTGPAPPTACPQQVGPNGEEWDFSKLTLLQQVELPKVDFARCIASAFPKDAEVVKQVLSPDLVDNIETLKLLLKSMKPASRTRARLLIERLLGGTLDMAHLLAEGEIKIFVKGDELLFKAKPRLICFVPTVWWILTVMWLTEILDVIKNKNDWVVKHCDVECHWASGMTQHKLSKAFTRAFHRELRDGVRFVFVCGDDNIDLTDTSDASMYDSTQSGEFAKCQFASMRAAGLPAWVTQKMQKQHEQNYVARNKLTKIKVKIVKGKQVATSLPSGAAWTLFANSLGIIIYSGAVEVARKHFYPNGYPSDTVRTAFKQAVAAALGLSMKVDPNPAGCVGAEFLKGQFIPCGDAFWWTPIPSRLCKWAKALGTKVHDATFMEERLRGVALSNRDALLPRLLRTWVDQWVASAGRASDLEWEYRMIEYGATTEEDLQELRAVQGHADWDEACRAVTCDRYGLTIEAYELMCEEMRKYALTAGHFGGEHWARLAQRDYLGL